MPVPEQYDDDALLERAKADWRRAYSHWRRWRTEAKEDFEFVAGNQWSDEDKSALDRQGRPVVAFNKTAPMVDAVAGSEIQNRQEVRYIPREVGDAAINEVYTAAVKYFRDQCDAEDEESTAFLDCTTCGQGWVETSISFDDDPDGTIVIERVDPFEVFVDPSSRKGNFADARFVFRVKDLTKAEVEAEWPGATEAMLPGSFSWGDVEEPNSEEPNHRIVGQQYEVGRGKGGSARRKCYRVVEYQWFEKRPIWRLVGPDGSEILLENDRFNKTNKVLKRLGLPPLPAIRQERREVMRAFFLGDKVLEEGPGPCPTSFTYQAITGKLDRNAGTFYGIVRPMKDPQRWANKFFSQIMHILNTNAKGGILAEVDAVADQRDFEQRWAEADSIMWLNRGGLQKVMPKPLAQVPTDLNAMMAYCTQSLRDVTGINLELLGMAESVQPGVLEYQRRQSGLMILATLFNSLRRYRKRQGRLNLYLIQEYIPEGTLIRIEGPQGARYVPLTKQQDVTKFDIVVDAAPSSPNLKEQVFSVMQIIAPQLLQMGIKIPAEALDYLPLPESLVQAIRNANSGESDQPDPATQAIQAQIQLEGQKMAADAQLAQQKLTAEAQMRQAELAMEAEIQRQQLELKRQQADVEAQIETSKLQLEQLKLQAMLDKIIPGGGPPIEEDVARLETFLSEGMNKLTGTIDALHQKVEAMDSRNSEVSTAMAALQQRAFAPRMVVRDETGRVIGSRIVGATNEPLTAQAQGAMMPEASPSADMES